MYNIEHLSSIFVNNRICDAYSILFTHFNTNTRRVLYIIYAKRVYTRYTREMRIHDEFRSHKCEQRASAFINSIDPILFIPVILAHFN